MHYGFMFIIMFNAFACMYCISTLPVSMPATMSGVCPSKSITMLTMITH